MTKTKEQVKSIEKRATNRIKNQLVLTPKEAVKDCITSLKNRGVTKIMVVGMDNFTSLFLTEVMKRTEIVVLFSDPDEAVATAMFRILSSFNNSANRVHYVNSGVALTETWASALILGTTENSLKYFGGRTNTYEEVVVLEEF
jgi:hypothetical protein